MSGNLHSGDCQLHGLDTTPNTSETGPADFWDELALKYQLGENSAKPEVQRYLSFYRDREKFLKIITERASRYLFFIASEVDKRNMPMEFALLPAIESSFDPFAYSRGRAAGLWQFVPITAKHVGLPNSWWYDGRRDVVASTQAALDYLQELNKQFDGDWLLSLAAYNSGATTVRRAIERNRKAGRATDYWSLSLPEETESYVPKLIALTQLVKHAKDEGIELPELAMEPTFDLVETGGQIDLAQAAELAGISIEELYRYNPGFNRWATDPDGPHHLAIPVDHSEQFSTALAAIPPDKRINWSRYRVRSGDSLIAIARRFNIDIATIKAANDLNSNTIRAGQVLLMPSASMDSSHYALSIDQRLKVAQQRGASSSRKSVSHTVSTGDSLWSISRRYKVDVKDLARWNNMVPKDPLYPGRKLVIWQNHPTVAQRTNLNNVIRRVAYRVRSGDSLARIADRFKIHVNDIVKWNKLNPAKYLMPGQELSLYVDVTELSSR